MLLQLGTVCGPSARTFQGQGLEEALRTWLPIGLDLARAAEESPENGWEKQQKGVFGLAPSEGRERLCSRLLSREVVSPRILLSLCATFPSL